MTATATIRAMHQQDAAQLCPLLYQFHQETTYKDCPATDLPTLERIVALLLKQPERYGCFVAMEADELVGYCLGVIGPAHVFLPHVTLAAEFAWWVKPALRDSSIGGRLLSAFRLWGRRNGASMVSYGKPLTTTIIKPGVYSEQIVRAHLGGAHV